MIEEPDDDEKPDRLLQVEGYMWVLLLVLSALVLVASWVVPAFAYPEWSWR